MYVLPSPAERYGGAFLGGSGAATPTDSQLPAVAGPSESSSAPPWHLDSPLLWFAVIAAAAVGLAAVSTTVRVGPAKASASLGTP